MKLRRKKKRPENQDTVAKLQPNLPKTKKSTRSI